MPLDHKVRKEMGITVIEVAGRMVVGEPGTNILDAVEVALATGHRNIVLNLAEVRKVDSSGVGELIAAHGAAERVGGQLKLAGLSPKLADVLQITQLTGLLESYESEADAMSSFAGG